MRNRHTQPAAGVARPRGALVVDRLSRAVGSALLAAALVVTACAEPAPIPSRSHLEEIGRIGICHPSTSSGAPSWTGLDAQTWAAHRAHRHDRALSSATCLSGTPAHGRR